MKKLILAFQFLTIVPVKDMGEISDEDMGSTTVLFPVVGFAEGILLAFSATLFLKVFPAELANALLVLILAIMNGGLHLDGLSDTFDAIGSRGDTEKKLSIMKDSTVGPMGVIAIVMTLLLKYALLNAVYLQSNFAVYCLAVISTPLLSRWAMVPAAFYSKSARRDGLGRLFIEHTAKNELITSTILAIVLMTVLSVISVQFSYLMFYIMFAMPVLYAFSFLAVWGLKKLLSGMTGDSLGAVNEIAVLVFLMMVVVNNATLG
jgi:adenosylcobinamide-GDP ribazoletransferase